MSLQTNSGNALPAGEYTLRVEIGDKAGNITVKEISGIVVTGGDPKVTSQVIAWPSPFNPLSCGEMNISFTVSGDDNAQVGLYIHDTAGRLVWKEVRPASVLFADKGFKWDGYTQFGEITESGVYLIRVVDETNKKLIGKTKVMIIKKR